MLYRPTDGLVPPARKLLDRALLIGILRRTGNAPWWMVWSWIKADNEGNMGSLSNPCRCTASPPLTRSSRKVRTGSLSSMTNYNKELGSKAQTRRLELLERTCSDWHTNNESIAVRLRFTCPNNESTWLLVYKHLIGLLSSGVGSEPMERSVSWQSVSAVHGIQRHMIRLGLTRGITASVKTSHRRT